MRTQSVRVHKNTGNMNAHQNWEGRAYLRRMKRQKEIQHKCLVFIMTLCLVIIGTVSYHSIKTSASTGEDLYFKYYTNISVEHGDTLWSIAGEYMNDDYYTDRNTFIAEVQSINHLDAEGTLKSGQNLIVPYYSSEFK